MLSSSRYKRMTERDIIALAQGGDDKAVEHLLATYDDLIHNMVNKYGVRSYTEADILAECNLAAVRAIKLYRLESGISLSTVIHKYCHSVLVNLVEKSHRKKAGTGHVMLSLHDPTEWIDPPSAQNVEQDVIDNDEAAWMARTMMSSARDDTERAILRKIVDGKAMKAIASEIGVSYSVVKNVKDAARRAIAAALLIRSIRDDSDILEDETMYKPLNRMVILRPMAMPATTESGIVLPDSAKGDKNQIAEVIATGPNVSELAVGDRVIYSKFGGEGLKDDDGSDLVLISEERIIAVVTEDAI